MEEEHVCEQCGKRRATVHLTDFVDGAPVQRHLCQHCFAEREGNIPLPPATVLAQLLAAVVPELHEMGTHQCPDCGINYLEFRQSLKLGCPNDYRVFDAALEKLIDRVHGSTKHCGKVPRDAGGEEAIQARIQSLRERQEKAIAEENYELAAELRDRIRKLAQDGPDDSE